MGDSVSVQVVRSAETWQFFAFMFAAGTALCLSILDGTFPNRYWLKTSLKIVSFAGLFYLSFLNKWTRSRLVIFLGWLKTETYDSNSSVWKMNDSWPNVVTAISTAVLALGSIAAIVVAMRQLRASRKQAQIQHLLSLVQSFMQNPMIQYRTAAAKKWQTGETDTTEMLEIMNFFEEVGLLVRKGYLSGEDVWEMFGYCVFPVYWTTREIVAEQRKTDPNAFSNFTGLYDTLQYIEKTHSGTTDGCNEDALKSYWREEANVSIGTPVRNVRRRKAAAVTATGTTTS